MPPVSARRTAALDSHLITPSQQAVRRRRPAKMVLSDVSQETLNRLVTPVATSSRSSSGFSEPGDVRPHYLINHNELSRAMWEFKESTENFDMRRKENVLAKKRALSHGGNSGKCGLPTCDIAFPKRAPARCNACDKYFHLGCFWQLHVATSLTDPELCALKKQKTSNVEQLEQ